ncbi:MAG: CHAT domain-containing protein [Planctomycetes bacterium]|nr:CHAT domain-containing protein [Planctomycetota bacterium]
MPPHATLIVRHDLDSDPPKFIVERLGDGRAAPAVAVAPPNSVPVEGRPNARLTDELRWYLEVFLDYPFPPETEHAERVRAALRKWGRQTFDALFTPPPARRAYEQAVANGLAHLTLRVVSDSPAVLGWPWEALEDPEAGRLANQCQVERRLNVGRDPDPPKQLPRDRVNVLLVIARPYPEDVRYRSIARPLVEMADRLKLPVSIHVLRPPTFDNLRAHLKAHPAHYHVLHFDGHGSYRADGEPDDPIHPGGGQTLFAKEGRLVFEKDGKPDPIAATALSELLREHAVPAVVLNACQSAMVDGDARDQFASAAAALLKAGMRGVVAMAYALYVSGAQRFLPAFYREVFASGDLARAVRAGRQEMFRDQGRVCPRGTHKLEDWFVPVLYQHEPPDLSFAATAAAPAKRESRLPEEAREDKRADPYGFVGRDGAVLELERALHRDPAGVLITGLGGVGKTTLARGFLRWLDETNGLGDGALWFSFAGVRSAEYVFNRLGEVVFGNPAFATLDAGQKVELLVSALRERRVLIAWDNFESVRGIAGTAVTPNLSAEDADRLRDFLAGLRGGKTKVLITSRSTEDWLGAPNRGKPVALGGLDGEERWEYANAIVKDLGLTVDRTQSEVAKLLDLLRGHPLAMRVLLTRLEKESAAQLTARLEANFVAARSGAADESETRLFATLRFATDALPAAWQPLLVPLSLHDGYVVESLLTEMAKRAAPEMPAAAVGECLGALTHAGLLRSVGPGVYELHPLLTSYLRSAVARATGAGDDWGRAFVGVLAGVADSLTPRPLHKQRGPFGVLEGNFHSARRKAERLALGVEYCALTQTLATFALNTHRLSQAAALFADLAGWNERLGREGLQAGAYHQLGIVAQERRDLAGA